MQKIKKSQIFVTDLYCFLCKCIKKENILLAKAIQEKSRIPEIAGIDKEISHIDFLDLHCCIRAR